MDNKAKNQMELLQYMNQMKAIIYEITITP